VRLIVGMTGATGAIYGVRLLEVLRTLGAETHLVLSRWARETITVETGRSVDDVTSLASTVYRPGDQGAAISSGSFRVDGMVVAPCSMKTLAGIRTGYATDLVARAADVCIKERRRLVLLARESPMSPIHLENALELARLGVTIMPPVPSFYNRPRTIDEIVDYSVARVLDQFDLELPGARRWHGIPPAVDELTLPTLKG
jgi:flavin prenyltransferase